MTWSSMTFIQSEAGTINIYFISKDAAQDDIDIVHNASGWLDMLAFTTFSCCFAQITSLSCFIICSNISLLGFIQVCLSNCCSVMRCPVLMPRAHTLHQV